MQDLMSDGTGHGLPTIKKSILICTTHRSGSFWLCDLLNMTNESGRFTEHFNYKKSNSHLIDIPRPYVPAFYRAIKSGISSNGVFGTKILYPQLKDVERGFNEEGLHIGESGFDILTQRLSNIQIIRLRRKNRVRQAISYYRAQHTKKWWKVDDVANEPFLVDYLGLKHIRAIALEFERWERTWDKTLSRFPALPILDVSYEDLVENGSTEMPRLLSFLQLDAQSVSTTVTSKFKVQSDEYSEDVYRQYVKFDEGRTDVMLQRASMAAGRD